ncbi:choice-of-anchor P family protein [Nocardioides sp. DS6]|uniref:Choice-of-anchor P family protein n=1 Tax=Nocardioides eburneus TaxID=3231482 RepID=A0ABV3SZ33_9ACTN
MPRLLALGTAAAVAATGLTFAAPGSADAATVVSTPYVLRGFGYGLRVVGGSLPAASGDLGYTTSGCTNKAGVTHENHTAGVSLPGGLGSIGAVASKTWSTKVGNTVNRYTQSKVASITIGNSLGSLNIKGLTMTTHVWHNAAGFHSKATANAGSITGKIGPLALPGKLPTPGNPITIPGLLKLSIGAKKENVGPNWAGANIDGLRLQLLPTKTTINLAHSWAYMSKGIASGVFGGNAVATKVSALGGMVSSSGQPFRQMPCKSPQGKTLTKAIASVPLKVPGFPISVGAATSTVQGNQSKTKAWGRGISKVASISLGSGSTKLVVKGLVAQANVSRTGKGLSKLTRNSNGTHVASITLGGKSYTLSQLDGKSLDIPGLDQVVKIQTNVVSNEWQGIQVVGLRLTLLGASDASKTVIDLARTRIKIVKP